MAFAAACFIENKIACDREQPGGEFRRWPVAGSALPNSNKNLLGYVFHFRIIAQHSPHRSNHQRLMTFDQAFKGDSVAPSHLRHQGSVINLPSASLRHEKRTTETRSRLFGKPGRDFGGRGG